MQVELVEYMGTDLSVINAARVSFNKEKTELDEGDIGLLNYLVTNGHWSPFAHPQVSFRITATIQVARQLFRHRVGLTINEVSRRYVDYEPGYEWPEIWRGRPGKGQTKQGSSGPLPCDRQGEINMAIQEHERATTNLYNYLLEEGVAPEQARLVLPVAMQTTWIWTGSLIAFIRVLRERLAPDAQAETRAVAVEIHKVLKDLFPQCMLAWNVARGESGA